MATNDRSRPVGSTRRQFTKRIIATVAGLTLWHSRQFGDKTRGVVGAAPRATDPEPLVQFIPMIEGYPVPQYMPPGYRLFGQYIARSDGFRGGDSELAIFFKNPSSDIAYNRPLCVFIAGNPSLTRLPGTHRATPMPRDIVIGTGNAIGADYFPGWWRLSSVGVEGAMEWDEDDVHSLTLPIDRFLVGIRASRVAGVNEHELLRVAQSLTLDTVGA